MSDSTVDPTLESTDLFFSGKHGDTMVRIPTMVASPNGTLLAFCLGRNQPLVEQSDYQLGVDVLLRRSFDGGRTWDPTPLVNEGGGHPVPIVDQQTGGILLAIGDMRNQLIVLQSNDDGDTWSELASYDTDAVKRDDWLMSTTSTCHGIQLRTGRLMVPCYHQMSRQKIAEGSHVRGSHVMYSDDHGETWTVGDEIAPRTEECTVLESHDGRVYVNMRRHNRDYFDGFSGWGRRAIAWSEDNGESWSDLEIDNSLVDYSCNASVLRLTDADRHDRNRVLFSNPASPERREKLTVRLSYNECRTWPVAKLVDSGMCHYSDLVVMPDMSIGVLYEAGMRGARQHDLASVRPGAAKKDRPTAQQYNRITLARFDLKWLTDERDTA